MASTQRCLASLARLSLSAPSRVRPSPAVSTIPNFLLPSVAAPQQVRYATIIKKRTKKKRTFKTFRTWDLSSIEQYSLCDAVRYLRAFEVGRPPATIKYEVALKLKTQRNGPVLRNTIHLPYPVKSDTRVGVVCPEDSPVAAEARQLGAVVVGEESLFESIRNGDIPFNKLICHTESEAALKKANLGKVLGPRGLMPSGKTKTITNDLAKTMREVVGADEYRERNGVVRLAVGQLGFTPKMLADNIKAFAAAIKVGINNLDDRYTKQIDEVVLSSTNGPGFSLSGLFPPSDEKLTEQDLEGTM